MQHGEDGREPVVAVLARLRAELDEIGRRIDRNQAMIARATWTAGAADQDYVKAMQDADLNAQRVAGVADFLAALGDAAEPHWRIDTAQATGMLKLSEQMRSIGRAGHPVAAGNETDAGTVDLF